MADYKDGIVFSYDDGIGYGTIKSIQIKNIVRFTERVVKPRGMPTNIGMRVRYISYADWENEAKEVRLNDN